MNLTELCQSMSLAQSALHEFTDDHSTRHRVLKLLQLAEDNGVILSPEIIAVELADLEPEPETEPEKMSEAEAASVQGREETEA